MSDAEKLKIAKELFEDIASRESHNREQYVTSTKFFNGEQWPEPLRRMREQNPDGARPCLTINVLPHYVKQVTNEMRMNRPSIKVLPVDDGADQETAKVFQGLIRHIEQCSDADVVYNTAGRTGVIGGLGYWRILADYVDQEYGHQELYLRRITNPMTVYFGPCECPAGSDVQDVFITVLMSKKAFEREYPKAIENGWNTDGQGDTDWYLDDQVRLAEWFHVETKEHKAIVLPDGKRMKVSEFENIIRAQNISVEYHADATIIERVIEWKKLTGGAILKEQIVPGKYIPVVRYIGQEVEVDGKTYYYGMVRDAMDPARMRNYWRSCETEMIALAPKNPYIGAAGAFDSFEDDWAAANVSNRAYLEYNATDAAGNQIQMPQRQPAAPMPQAIVQAAANADLDIKSATGIFAAGLGERSNETSGKAILARQKEGDTSTFDYIDNLAVSIRHTGRILVDRIPLTYDVARVLRIIGEDDEPKHVQIDPNLPQPHQDADRPGIDGIYNLGVGKYDVAVTVGPSFTTKRQEAAESMATILQGNPQLWQIAGDIFAKTLDWPGATELAERMKRAVPPQLLSEKDQGPQSNPQDQAMIQKLDQTIQAMQAHIDKLEQAAGQQQTEQGKLLIEKAKLELETKKLEIENYRAETERMTLLVQNPGALEMLRPLAGAPPTAM